MTSDLSFRFESSKIILKKQDLREKLAQVFMRDWNLPWAKPVQTVHKSHLRIHIIFNFYNGMLSHPNSLKKFVIKIFMQFKTE